MTVGTDCSFEYNLLTHVEHQKLSRSNVGNVTSLLGVIIPAFFVLSQLHHPRLPPSPPSPPPSPTHRIFFLSIDGFYSRDLQSCGTQMTNVMTAMLVHITKEVH